MKSVTVDFINKLDEIRLRNHIGEPLNLIFADEAKELLQEFEIQLLKQWDLDHKKYDKAKFYDSGR